MTSLPSVTDCDSGLTRVAEARVQRRRKVGRLVAEVKSAHEVFFVEEIARPELHAPRVPLATDAQVREAVRLRHLIVAVVVEELVHARQVEPRPPTRRR